jgi:hypothetical protein
MHRMMLQIRLLSDAHFGRGDGLAGLVDQEVQHDRYGCPYLGGRSLEGRLAEACADVMDSLVRCALAVRYEGAGRRLFGEPGSLLNGSMMHVGDACLPEDLRQAVGYEMEHGRLTAGRVLDALTAIRRQTAMDATGVPKQHSLRSLRVILRSTAFISALTFRECPGEDDLALLAACVRALRYAGSGGSRGLGYLETSLCDANGDEVTAHYLEFFRRGVLLDAGAAV